MAFLVYLLIVLKVIFWLRTLLGISTFNYINFN
jgi:hypothetical protein